MIAAFSYLFLFTEEEEAEVKKSKLYQPAKFVPISQHASVVSSGESKKSVSLCSVCLMAKLLHLLQ